MNIASLLMHKIRCGCHRSALMKQSCKLCAGAGLRWRDGRVCWNQVACFMAHHGASWHIMAHHGTSWHCTQAIRSMPSHCLVSALAWTVLTGPARRLRITTGWSQQIKQAVAGRCYWTSLIVRVMRCLDQIGWQTTYAMMHVMFSVPQVVSKWPHGDTGVSFWCFFFVESSVYHQSWGLEMPKTRAWIGLTFSQNVGNLFEELRKLQLVLPGQFFRPEVLTCSGRRVLAATAFAMCGALDNLSRLSHVSI